MTTRRRPTRRRTTPRRAPDRPTAPQTFWRWFTIVWTGVTLALFIVDFIQPFRSAAVLGTVSTIYIATLSIFVGTKEFDRWLNVRNGRHYGELFIYLWTAVMVVLLAAGTIPGYRFQFRSELTTVYLAVLGLYAVTERSKALHRERLARHR